MFNKGSRVIISLLAVLTLVLGVSAFAFADSGSMPVPNPPANGVLFDENVSGGANVTSEEFTATTSNDINVYFENQGSEATNVTLQKHGFFGWSEVGSFSVSAGSQDYNAYSGDSKATYRVLLGNPQGSNVSGHLRVRQI